MGHQVDLEAALAALMGERELLQQLAQVFEEDAPPLLDELQQAVEQGAADQALKSAHKLKGLASTFFAEPTLRVVREVEMLAKDGDLDSIRGQKLNELFEAVTSLRKELSEL